VGSDGALVLRVAVVHPETVHPVPCLRIDPLGRSFLSVTIHPQRKALVALAFLAAGAAWLPWWVGPTLGAVQGAVYDRVLPGIGFFWVLAQVGVGDRATPLRRGSRWMVGGWAAAVCLWAAWRWAELCLPALRWGGSGFFSPDFVDAHAPAALRWAPAPMALLGVGLAAVVVLQRWAAAPGPGRGAMLAGGLLLAVSGVGLLSLGAVAAFHTTRDLCASVEPGQTSLREVILAGRATDADWLWERAEEREFTVAHTWVTFYRPMCTVTLEGTRVVGKRFRVFD